MWREFAELAVIVVGRGKQSKPANVLSKFGHGWGPGGLRRRSCTHSGTSSRRGLRTPSPARRLQAGAERGRKRQERGAMIWIHNGKFIPPNHKPYFRGAEKHIQHGRNSSNETIFQYFPHLRGQACVCHASPLMGDVPPTVRLAGSRCFVADFLPPFLFLRCRKICPRCCT